MGWMVFTRDGYTVIAHAGDTANYHRDMALFPEEGLGIVTLANANGILQNGQMSLPAFGVAELILGRDLDGLHMPDLAVLAIIFTLLPGVLLLVWAPLSLRRLRRARDRGLLPPHGTGPVIRRSLLPLGADLFLAAFPFVISPAITKTPLEIIPLFSPDLFIISLVTTAAGIALLGWRLWRTWRARAAAGSRR